MATLTFYYQARFDGGWRTGVAIDDDADRLDFFEPPQGEEDDPRLLWYVDIRCEGDKLPTQAQPARDWFLSHESYFVTALRDTAEAVAVGLDSGVWPYRRELPAAPSGGRAWVVVHAVRRLTGRSMAENVRAAAGSWRALLDRLAHLSVTCGVISADERFP